jgi:hypothetical protein
MFNRTHGVKLACLRVEALPFFVKKLLLDLMRLHLWLTAKYVFKNFLGEDLGRYSMLHPSHHLHLLFPFDHPFGDLFLFTDFSVVEGNNCAYCEQYSCNLDQQIVVVVFL